VIPVTRQDVETSPALERELTDDEAEKFPGRAQRASELVEGYIGFEYDPDDTARPIPAVVTSVVADVVARLYAAADSNVPQFVDSKTQNMGQLGATVRYNADATSARAPWLAKSDKTRLRGVFSGMRTTSSRSDRWHS
jgi:hypothetical protein